MPRPLNAEVCLEGLEAVGFVSLTEALVPADELPVVEDHGHGAHPRSSRHLVPELVVALGVKVDDLEGDVPGLEEGLGQVAEPALLGGVDDHAAGDDVGGASDGGRSKIGGLDGEASGGPDEGGSEGGGLTHLGLYFSGSGQTQKLNLPIGRPKLSFQANLALKTSFFKMSSVTVKRAFKNRAVALRWILPQNLVTLALESKPDDVQPCLREVDTLVNIFVGRCLKAVVDEKGELAFTTERKAIQAVNEMLDDDWSDSLDPLQDRVVDLLIRWTSVGALVLDPETETRRRRPSSLLRQLYELLPRGTGLFRRGGGGG